MYKSCQITYHIHLAYIWDKNESELDNASVDTFTKSEVQINII